MYQLHLHKQWISVLSSHFLWTVWLMIVNLTEVNSLLNISLNFIFLITDVVRLSKCFLDPQISIFKNSALQIRIQKHFLIMVLKKVALEGPHITIIQTTNEKVIGNWNKSETLQAITVKPWSSIMLFSVVLSLLAITIWRLQNTAKQIEVSNSKLYMVVSIRMTCCSPQKPIMICKKTPRPKRHFHQMLKHKIKIENSQTFIQKIIRKMRRKSEKHDRSASRGSHSQNEPQQRGKDFWIKNTKTLGWIQGRSYRWEELLW